MNFENESFTHGLDELSERYANGNETYAYIKSKAKYYYIEKKIFFSPTDVANNLMCSNKELYGLRMYGNIETYDDICYFKGGKEGCLNLLDEGNILQPSDAPIIDKSIRVLIENVAGNKKENIDYLHKCILYKYHNLNDYTIPAIVLYGTGGTGKGTLISLLSTIFGEENVMGGLGQRELSGSFDTYKGQKLVVSFDELATSNTNSDIRILNRLKNLIGAEKITINEKGVKQYQTENIGWFFISSNSNKPVQLDDKDKGNRRFTIIRSYKELDDGNTINKAIKDKGLVKNYLAWLYKNYPEVLKYKKIEALDNQDKRELEERNQSEANKFWDWLKESYPDFTGKKRVIYINDKISEYCSENEINQYEFNKYFWLHSKYTRENIRFPDKVYSGVNIK